jgi:hypothetical protein
MTTRSFRPLLVRNTMRREARWLGSQRPDRLVPPDPKHGRTPEPACLICDARRARMAWGAALARQHHMPYGYTMTTPRYD